MYVSINFIVKKQIIENLLFSIFLKLRLPSFLILQQHLFDLKIYYFDFHLCQTLNFWLLVQANLFLANLSNLFIPNLAFLGFEIFSFHQMNYLIWFSLFFKRLLFGFVLFFKDPILSAIKFSLNVLSHLYVQNHLKIAYCLYLSYPE